MNQPNLDKNVWRNLAVITQTDLLVGGSTNPVEKYARPIGNIPQFSGWK